MDLFVYRGTSSSHIAWRSTSLGVTTLRGEIYVLRLKGRDEVEVYDVTTYLLQRCLTAPNAKGFIDMTSCEHYVCLYISDDNI